MAWGAAPFGVLRGRTQMSYFHSPQLYHTSFWSVWQGRLKAGMKRVLACFLFLRGSERGKTTTPCLAERHVSHFALFHEFSEKAEQCAT
jgi:hypothetical protein